MTQNMLRKSVLLLMLIVGFTAMQAQSLKITDPVKYNDYIVSEQNRIGTELLKLIDMFSALPEDQSVAVDQLEVIIETANSAKDNLKNLKTIPNEFGLKQAASELFAFYAVTMDTDYRKVIDQLYADEPDMTFMQEVLVKIQTAEGIVDKNFQEKQEKFAQFHNIKLEENQLQEEFEEEEGE